VADIIRSLASGAGEVPGLRMSAAQRRVLCALAICRTAQLGGHVEQCDDCRHQRIAYNSCRNRHCPKCQARNRAQWLEARAKDLLAVPYFHVVFTVPQEVAQLALQNKRVVYDILFRTASQTLKGIAADPKHLGADIGFLAVLHTWGQTLMHHPHLHCVVPGGGLSPDGTQWVSARDNYFLPVQVLAKLYRGKFLAALRMARERGELRFFGKLQALSNDGRFRAWLTRLYTKPWVVYAKRPFGGPEQVLKYLAGYTHRVAIANRRLLSLENGRVRFRYKDYARNHEPRVMELDGVEFLRRFLLHVLPTGFVRIRHYGFLANRCRREKVPRCTQLIANASGTPPCPSVATSIDREAGASPTRCPQCGEGSMVIIEKLAPGASPRVDSSPPLLDSS
jgi:hypothetical protein